MKIFIIAGEESGDILGADLMASFKKRYKKDTDLIFRGIGGNRMQNEGLVSLFPMNELSVMGIFEVAPKIPHLLKRIKQTADAIEIFQPDLLITIDSPDFCFRVAKQIKNRQISIPFKVHYVAPSVWAWRPKRAKKIAELYNAVLCLFPFEPPYFEAEGMLAEFVGHPMSKLLKDIKSEDFLNKQEISEKIKIGLLLGSRQGEIDRMAPVFLNALKLILVETKDIVLICPTLPHLEEKVRGIIAGAKLGIPVLIISDPAEKFQAMKSCDVAMATSGTVGLELCILGTPHVIAYKMNALTYEIGKRMITTKYAHLGNIIMQAGIVPEFIQDEATPQAISSAILDLMKNETIRQDQIGSFKIINDKIRGTDDLSPSDRCISFILEKMKS